VVLGGGKKKLIHIKLVSRTAGQSEAKLIASLARIPWNPIIVVRNPASGDLTSKTTATDQPIGTL